MTDYDSSGTWNELLDELQSELENAVSREIGDAQSSYVVNDEKSQMLDGIYTDISRSIDSLIDDIRESIDLNTEYDMFEYMWSSDNNDFSENVQFHRHRKITAICVDGQPDPYQIIVVLNSEDGNSDIVLFGHGVPLSARTEFFRTRVGDRYFKYSQ